MERKLAAILAADVVGYSALMERDEKGTFERLQKVRKEVFEPEIERFGGHVFKLMGDGLLAEFESVVGAVECAVALQQSIAERNGDMATKERLDFRIGINIGDDIVEGSDRYGEGVNIAARLQQLAEPGGICLSRTVIDHLGNKLPIAIEAMGEHRLKNIARPIEVYRVRLRDGDAAKPITKPVRTIAGSSRMAAASAILLVAVGGLAWLGPWGKAPEPTSAASSVVVGAGPSLVVLPFQSLSDDKNQAYLAEGITDDLTTALARIPGLFVISHNSALPYRIKVEPTLIAEELGISYILEGSIRRGGDDTTRINAQLIHAPTGRHIWAERFDGAWGDIFGLQDQVVSSVASALALRLVGGSRIAEVPGGTRNATAYNYYLHGYELNYADSPAKAAEAYRQAVALDPGFGLAWAELAWVYWSAAGDSAAQAALGAGSYEETVNELRSLLEEAEKRPSSTFYQLKAGLLFYQRSSDEAISAAERAVALDPSDSWAYEQMARALAYNGRATDAKAYLDAAVRVDPHGSSSRLLLAGLVYFSLGQFEGAIAALDAIDPKTFNFFNNQQRLFLLAAAHAHLGHAEMSAKSAADLETYRDANGLRAVSYLPFRQPADTARLLTGLTNAGVPDLPFGYRWDSKDRLTGEEIKLLIFGNEVRGRDMDTGEPYTRKTALDGSSGISIGSFSRKGTSKVDGNLICSLWDIAIAMNCATIFRNPNGTRAGRNEYVFVTHEQRVEFSVVE